MIGTVIVLGVFLLIGIAAMVCEARAGRPDSSGPGEPGERGDR